MKDAVGRLLCVTGICLIVASALGSLAVSPLSLDDSSEQSDEYRSTVGHARGTQTLSYTPHAPLYIVGDAAFDAAKTANGWTGDGLTAATPYEIKGYSIVNTVQEIIYIESTTRYFVIKDNLLDAMDGGLDGVFLKQVQHGRIEFNIIQNCRHGVYIRGGSDDSVRNNTIQTCSQSGIRVFQSAATLYGNHIESAVYNAIWLEGGSDVEVLENEIHTNTQNGILVDGRQEGTDYYHNEDHLIEHNYIHDVDNGVFLYTDESGLFVHYVNVTRNIFVNNTYSGVYLSGAYTLGCRITDNNVSGSEGYGIVLDESAASNTVSGNWIHGSSLGGMYLATFADSNIIVGNTVYDCPTGIRLNSGANANEFLLNTLYDPHGITTNGIGFRLDAACDDNTILNNTISNSTSYGLYLEANADGNLVMHNSFLTNNIGGSSQALCNGPTTSQCFRNFWDEWTSPDDDHDGYVDLPYDIDGTAGMTDPEPLASPANPIGYHALTPIAVTYPNGGEVVNGSATITWTTPVDTKGHSVSYTVQYSNNSGVDWYEIVTDITTASYLWDTASLAAGSEYLVKVIAECSELLTTTDTSDAVFTIQAHELTAPELIYPIGSENVYGTATIRWQASSDSWGGNITYAVYYSGNGGSDWFEISSSLTATNCSWDTAGLPGGSNYVVKVVASCDHEEAAEAWSGAFTLVPTSTTTTTTTNTTTATTTTTTGATTTTTTTTQTGPGMDSTVLILFAAGLIVVVLAVACVLGRSRLGHGGGGSG